MRHVMIMIIIIIVIFDMSHMTKVVFFIRRMTNHLISIFLPKLKLFIFWIILINNIFVVGR
jgi:hypothetical protein